MHLLRAEKRTEHCNLHRYFFIYIILCIKLYFTYISDYSVFLLYLVKVTLYSVSGHQLVIFQGSVKKEKFKIAQSKECALFLLLFISTIQHHISTTMWLN